MKYKVGTVTIGQAPRVDITPDLRKIVGDDIDIVEAGALDGLTSEQIASMAPHKGDYVLVTRMADGTSVTVSEHAVTPLLKEKINEHFNNGINTVLLLCTGEFPGFATGGLLLTPQKLLFNFVSSVTSGLKLGIFMPSPDQIVQSTARWSKVSSDTKSVGASPYVNPELTIPAAAKELAEWGADVIIMDCMGYSLAMKETVRKITGKPVILARAVAARALSELI